MMELTRSLHLAGRDAAQDRHDRGPEGPRGAVGGAADRAPPAARLHHPVRRAFVAVLLPFLVASPDPPTNRHLRPPHLPLTAPPPSSHPTHAHTPHTPHPAAPPPPPSAPTAATASTCSRRAPRTPAPRLSSRRAWPCGRSWPRSGGASAPCPSSLGGRSSPTSPTSAGAGRTCPRGRILAHCAAQHRPQLAARPLSFFQQ